MVFVIRRFVGSRKAHTGIGMRMSWLLLLLVVSRTLLLLVVVLMVLVVGWWMALFFVNISYSFTRGNAAPSTGAAAAEGDVVAQIAEGLTVTRTERLLFDAPRRLMTDVQIAVVFVVVVIVLVIERPQIEVFSALLLLLLLWMMMAMFLVFLLLLLL